MESLTKDNFWNALMESHPKATKEFCDWIDDYKKEVDWKTLFYTPNSVQHRDVKFHDVPIDMQLGIILWYLEMKEGETFNREQYIQYMRERITDFFIDREITLKNG